MEIEVCERLNDYTFVTVADETGKAIQVCRAKYHAQIKGEPGFWGSGASPAEAIGDLVSAHAHRFGITITTLPMPTAR